MVRTVGPITAINRKIAAGETISPEERKLIQAHRRPYAKRKQGVHLAEPRRVAWIDLAAKSGNSLSSWIQERVEEALHGDDEEKQELLAEKERMRNEIVALRGTSGQIAAENSQLHTRLAGLEQTLTKAMDELLRLQEEDDGLE